MCVQCIEMIGSERIAFVDLQGFLVNRKDFVLKELCFSINTVVNREKIIDIVPNYHYIFHPPFHWKYLSGISRKQAIWLSAFHHGFYWTQGEVSYDNINDCMAPLMEKDLIVFVKGKPKIEWLKQLSGYGAIDCRNVEDDGCEINLNESSHCDEFKHCGKHRKTGNCSLQNVEIIQKWFLGQNEQTAGRK